MRYLRLMLLVFVGSCIAGCGTGNYRLHSGENTVLSQVATVKGGRPIDLYEVDGKPGTNFGGANRPRRYNSSWDRSFTVELLPGTHKFKVGYLDIQSTERTYYSEKPFIITLEAQPGAIYVIEWELFFDPWEPRVRRVNSPE